MLLDKEKDERENKLNNVRGHLPLPYPSCLLHANKNKIIHVTFQPYDV